MQTQDTKKVTPEEYAKKIAREDQAITNIIDRVGKMFDAVLNRDGDLEKAVPLMNEAVRILRDRIKIYFDMQERFGILEDLKTDYPRVQNSVAHIYDGDHKLVDSFAELYARLKTFGKHATKEGLQDLYHIFLTDVDHLKSHQDHINQLIMDTYTIDIGSCD